MNPSRIVDDGENDILVGAGEVLRESHTKLRGNGTGGVAERLTSPGTQHDGLVIMGESDRKHFEDSGPHEKRDLSFSPPCS
jgi:hypothetical protein